MAYYCVTITVPNPVDEAFQFVSDLRHSVWDPRVLRASKITDGPLGVGTRFELTSRFLFLNFGLPYTIDVFDRPYRLELTGTTRVMRYHDAITFAPVGDGARITYCADLTLRSLFKIGAPVLRSAFPAICRDATRGLQDALEREFATS